MLKARSTPDWAISLALLFGVQAIATWLTRIQSTLAPQMTVRLGVDSAFVGYLNAASTAGTMVFLLVAAPLEHRWGPVRLLHAGLVAGIAAVLCLGSPSVTLTLLGAALAGLCYGPSTTVASAVLFDAVPARRLAFAFSLKQAAVPFGAAICALVLTSVALHMSWLVALFGSLLLPVAGLLAVHVMRRRIEPDSEQPEIPPVSLGAFAFVLRDPALRRSSLVGAGLAVSQSVWLAYALIHFAENGHLRPAQAALLFALLQAVAIPARIATGLLGDRIGGVRVLMIVVPLSVLACLAGAMVGPDWPWLACAALSIFAGLCCLSWNGVQLAVTSELAPAGTVSQATAGTLLVIFGAYTLSSAALAALSSYTGSLSGAFAAAGFTTSLAMVPAWKLWASRLRS